MAYSSNACSQVAPRIFPQRSLTAYSSTHIQQLTTLTSTVQSPAHPRQNRPSPLPRQPHLQRNSLLPAHPLPRPTNRPRRLRRRSAQPTSLQSRRPRLPSHRLHTRSHGRTARGCGCAVDRGEADGCGCFVLGGHTQV